MISLKNVSKSFSSKKVIDDFTYDFLDSKNYLVIGKSGNGKSTLFNLITGLIIPDSGKIQMANRYSPLFQQNRLLEQYSALENIQVVTNKDVKEISLELLNEEELNKKVKYLSGGQKQRVCILRALCADSECIIMDEPFTGLDKKMAVKALKTIIKYKNNRTLIIISHNVELFDDSFTTISLN